VREAARTCIYDQEGKTLGGGELRDVSRVGQFVEQPGVPWREVYVDSASFVSGVAAVLEPFSGSGFASNVVAL